MEWKVIREFEKTYPNGRVRKQTALKCSCGFERIINSSEWKRFLNGVNTERLNNKCQKCLNQDKKDKLNHNDAYRMIYSANKRQAERLNRTFTINIETATQLYRSNCFYCNRPPHNNFQIKHAKKYFTYSGIDRVDSSKGYDDDNVVSCCFDCNRSKSNLSQDSFLELISKIYFNRVQRLSREGVGSSDSK